MYIKNEPTGFHLIMLLKSDVSCSSVHTSDMTLSVTNSPFLEVGGPSSACSTASPAGVDVALEGRRTFFLGGMAENHVQMEKISTYESERNIQESHCLKENPQWGRHRSHCVEQIAW